jgi:hypothetical protein
MAYLPREFYQSTKILQLTGRCDQHYVPCINVDFLNLDPLLLDHVATQLSSREWVDRVPLKFLS